MTKVGAKDGTSPTIPPASVNIGAELNDIYHKAVIATKGDVKAAEKAKRDAEPRVQQFAQFLETARTSSGKGAATALLEARKFLGDRASTLDSWIHHHVDESVIRAAGLDPADMAKAAGVTTEADTEKAGRDYRKFKGESADLPSSEAAGDGMNVTNFDTPRRV